jgi:phosphoribosylaminoimidazole carboxylase (NCAIR synthetase)
MWFVNSTNDIDCACVSRQILLNEVAPRPHNSGHHTIESCYTSQYEQHLRAVVGLPLGDPSMKTPAAIMYNILGEEEVLLAYKFYPISFPFYLHCCKFNKGLDFSYPCK